MWAIVLDRHKTNIADGLKEFGNLLEDVGF